MPLTVTCCQLPIFPPIKVTDEPLGRLVYGSNTLDLEFIVRWTLPDTRTTAVWVLAPATAGLGVGVVEGDGDGVSEGEGEGEVLEASLSCSTWYLRSVMVP